VSAGQLQGATTLVPAAPVASPYAGGCSPTALPAAQWVVNGGPCSPPTAQLGAAPAGMPYTGFLVAGFNGFCTEDQLKEIIGRCAYRSLTHTYK